MKGIINVLKPPGITSNGVIVYLKKLLDVKKIGHAGTLDPAAAGVLPIFIGKATRLIEYTIDAEKVYIGEICFGAATDTQDAQGRVTFTSDKIISQNDAEELFKSITGEILQTPPNFSAVKYKGQRAYKLARQGKTVDLPPRKINIYSSSVLSQTGRNKYLFKITCSKGTYVRTLCHDLGIKAGAYAHLSFLLRERVGNFKLEDSHTLEEISCAHQQGELNRIVLPIETAVINLPTITINKEVEKMALNGMSIPLCKGMFQKAENVDSKLMCEGKFIGICRVENRVIRPLKIIKGDEI